MGFVGYGVLALICIGLVLFLVRNRIKSAYVGSIIVDDKTIVATFFKVINIDSWDWLSDRGLYGMFHFGGASYSAVQEKAILLQYFGMQGKDLRKNNHTFVGYKSETDDKYYVRYFSNTLHYQEVQIPEKIFFELRNAIQERQENQAKLIIQKENDRVTMGLKRLINDVGVTKDDVERVRG